jgi:hypothetical protein
MELLGLGQMLSHQGRHTSGDRTAKGDADAMAVRLAIKTVANENRMVSFSTERRASDGDGPQELGRDIEQGPPLYHEMFSRLPVHQIRLRASVSFLDATSS